MQKAINKAEGRDRPMVSIERFDFYDAARDAYAVIQTGERRFYGCFIFRKGVIPPAGVDSMSDRIVILGVFVADTAYRADRAPEMGETIMGNSFALGPGGKGSNQAVAAAKAGGEVHFVSKLGRDTFADMALKTWAEAGVIPAVTQHDDSYTGAAYIFIEEATGNNAIIICPGIASTISADDIEAHAELIAGAKVFITQLEQPMPAAHRALEIARQGGAITILNPAPAAEITPEMLALCDYVTPNETEAEGADRDQGLGPRRCP